MHSFLSASQSLEPLDLEENWNGSTSLFVLLTPPGAYFLASSNSTADLAYREPSFFSPLSSSPKPGC
jgi:hypothetical protein